MSEVLSFMGNHPFLTVILVSIILYAPVHIIQAVRGNTID